MAKKAKFTLHSDLSVEQLHAVLSSERYLISKDEMEDSHKADIVDSHYNVREDGVVASKVRMRSRPEAGVEHNQGSEEAGQQTPPAMEIEQTAHVAPCGSDRKGTGFRVSTITSLPGNIGSIFTEMDSTPDAAADGDPARPGSDVHVEVKVEVKIPIVGGKLAKQLLGNSEETVSKGLRRAARLAE